MTKFALLRRRVFVSGLSALTICTLAFNSVGAAPLPQPPADTEVMVRLLPSERTLTPTQRARVLRHPLWRLLGGLPWSRSSDVELHSVVEQFEGTAVFGIRSRADGTSSIADFLRDHQLREQRESLVYEMESLTEDLVYHQLEHERFPADFDDYIENVRYYPPYLPDGYQLRYRPNANGSRFELSVEASRDAEMLKLGPLPSYRSGVGFENLQPTAAPAALNLVGGVKVNDPAAAKDLLDRILGPARGGFWQTELGDHLPLVLTLRGDWLAMSDAQRNLGELFETLNGRKPGLAGSANYRTVARNIDAEAPLFFYFDPAGLMGLLERPESEVPTSLAPVLQTAGAMGYAFVEWPQSQMKIEAFLGLNPPQDSPLAAYLASSRGVEPGPEMSLSNVSWDAGNVLCLDYRSSKEFLDAVVALVPNATVPYEMGQDIFAGFLGLDAEKGFNELLEGPVMLSFERIDILIGFLEEMLDEPAYVPYEGYGDGEGYGEEHGDLYPEDEVPLEELGLTPLGDEESIPEELPEEALSAEHSGAEELLDSAVWEPEENSEEESDDEAFDEVQDETLDARTPPEPIWMPFTVAFQVSEADEREVLVGLLERVMGERIEDVVLDGYPARASADGSLIYCLHDGWLYISGGKTERLMLDMLAAADGRVPSLESIDSWSRFRTSQRGRLVGYGHQKVDAWYSVVKGFLLFLGPEFRPVAEELGHMRDYHAAMTVVPDGVLLTGEILRGDGP